MTASVSDDWIRLQKESHALLNWFLDVKSRGIDFEGGHRKFAIARHLAASYKVLGERIKSAKGESRDRPSLVDVDLFKAGRSKVAGLVDPLVDYLNETLTEHVEFGIFHGSMADDQISLGWSDVDTWIVLKNDVVNEELKLVAVRQACLNAWAHVKRICEYQHHGHIFLAEFEREYYPVSYMPEPAFKHAKCFIGNRQSFSLNMIPSSDGCRESLQERLDVALRALDSGKYKHHPYGGRYLDTDLGNGRDSMHQLFAYLCYIMLVPSLCMEAVGSPCYKADSFQNVRPLLSDDSLGHLDRLSYIRDEWEKRENFERHNNDVPAWLLKELGSGYMREGVALLADVLRVIEESN